MEFIIGIAVLGGLLFLLFSRSAKTTDTTPDVRPAADFDDDLDTVDIWEEFEVTENRPEGNWVGWPGGAFNVAGTGSYVTGRQNLINMGMKGTVTATASLIREPNNPRDKNAIRVMVQIARGPNVTTHQIGYVPADKAERIAQEFAPEMPVAAEITRMASNGRNLAITLRGLMPPKKARTEFEFHPND